MNQTSHCLLKIRAVFLYHVCGILPRLRYSCIDPVPIIIGPLGHQIQHPFFIETLKNFLDLCSVYETYDQGNMRKGQNEEMSGSEVKARSRTLSKKWK